MNESAEPPRASSPRRLKRLTVLGLIAVALGSGFAAVTVFGILPWLGRRGDLNPLIERILSASLTVPVRIAHLDSRPLSELTVTELRSVAFEAEDRIRFETRTISLTYDPIELLAGHVRRLAFEEPTVAIHLGSDLASIGQVPSEGMDGEPWTTDDEALFPITVEAFELRDATVVVELDGRRTPFDGLQLTIDRFGWRLGQEFRLQLNAFGGRLTATGRMDVPPGDRERYVLEKVEVTLEDVYLTELLSWLLPGALVTGGRLPSGRLSLRGELTGVWPEEIELRLESTTDQIAAHPTEGLDVKNAQLGLGLTARVWGEFDRVALQVDSRVQADWKSPSRQQTDEATLSIDTEYRRDGESPLLEVKRFQLRHNESRVEVSGAVRSPLHDAQLKLRVVAEGLQVAEALEHLQHLVPLTSTWRGLAGEVAFQADVSGAALHPQSAGKFSLTNVRYDTGDGSLAPGDLSGTFAGLRVEGATQTVRCERFEVDLECADLQQTTECVSQLLPAPLTLPDVALDGKATLNVKAETLELPWRSRPFSVEALLDWRGETLHTPLVDTGAITARWHAEGHARPGEITFATNLKLKTEEFLSGRFYYSAPREEWFECSARGRLVEGPQQRLDVSHATASSPLTGPLELTTSLSLDAVEQMTFSVKATDIPLERATRFFLVEPLKESFPFLETLVVSGSARAEIENHRDVGLQGLVKLENTDVSCGRLELEGAFLELPLTLGSGQASRRDGKLSARRISHGFVTAGAVSIPFSLEGRTYRLTSAVEQELLGGVLDVTSAELSVGDPIELTAIVNGRDFDLGEITTTSGLPHIRGRADVELSPLHLSGNDLDCPGRLTIHAFGGAVELSDITFTNLLEPYRSLSLRRGSVRGIDLGEIGRVFHVGILSGVLDGTLSNVGFTAGDLTSFDVDLETVSRAGIPQFVDRRAVESLRAIVEGHVGALEGTLASRFRYGKFGFRTRLEDGMFHIQGKYLRDGKEYIMYPYWYQLPRITIVNSQPDPYPWEAIRAQFEKIYSENDA